MTLLATSAETRRLARRVFGMEISKADQSTFSTRRKIMKQIVRTLGVWVLLLVSGAVFAASSAAEIDKERAEVRKTSAEVLNKLYKVQPSAKQAVQSAAGYAAFSNFGMKILVAGSGTGKGIARKKGGSYAGAIPLGNGVYVYQMTDKGLAAELTVKGTKYYKDDDLN